MTDFAALRKQVCDVNQGLHTYALVTMHSGNASGVHRESGLVLIKPSGIDIDTLTPDKLVVVNLNGDRVTAAAVPDGVSSTLKPSVDLVHHIGLYQADESLGGIVHTHSVYATAWAAVGRAIPCALTAMADEFGGDIPCAPYADNEGANIVNSILASRTRAPAMLLAGHGVFTFAETPVAALKAAVMVECVAQTLYLAAALGTVRPMAPVEIEKWWDRYHNRYGQ